ncbi:MAG: pseudouridine-5'-phosphate glycosidase [Actinomycetota bacterium]|nr:pseudouridine-5'-phosphate glycosidase [Actinomycetota bacterium]
MEIVIVADEVRSALAEGRPVVALESTIFSPFGLPAPANAEALARCMAAVRAGGAVPALTAVLDGRARVGLEAAEHERILNGGVKLGERDLPVALATNEPVGVTTVSATLALAARVGIEVFATGGIGGVHRGVERTGDVSADLGALARHPVVTVSAGAKAILDIARTLELLETLGVPVLGWQTEFFPMFWCRTSGHGVRRVERAGEVAATLRALRDLNLTRGVLLAVPIAEGDAIAPEVIEAAIASVPTDDLVGPGATPRMLAAIAVATEGRTVTANLALAEQNARVAAGIAEALVIS